MFYYTNTTLFVFNNQNFKEKVYPILVKFASTEDLYNQLYNPG